METFLYDLENRLIEYERIWTAADQKRIKLKGYFQYNDGYERINTQFTEGYKDPPYLEWEPWNYLGSENSDYFYAPGSDQ